MTKPWFNVRAEFIIHTRYQEASWPVYGYEVTEVTNSQASLGKRTGSL